MKQFFSGKFASTLFILVATIQTANSQENKEEERVYSVASEFVKHFNAGDTEAMMKLSSIPFMPGTPKQYITQRIVKDVDPRVYTEADLAKALIKFKGEQLPVKMSRIIPFRPSPFQSVSQKEVRKATNELMANGGYSVSFVTNRGPASHSVGILITTQNNQLKVVGWLGRPPPKSWYTKSSRFGRQP